MLSIFILQSMLTTHDSNVRIRELHLSISFPKSLIKHPNCMLLLARCVEVQSFKTTSRTFAFVVLLKTHCTGLFLA